MPPCVLESPIHRMRTWAVADKQGSAINAPRQRTTARGITPFSFLYWRIATQSRNERLNPFASGCACIVAVSACPVLVPFDAPFRNAGCFVATRAREIAGSRALHVPENVHLPAEKAPHALGYDRPEVIEVHHVAHGALQSARTPSN